MDLDFTDNFLLCGAYPEAAVAERLRELPRLRTLKISMGRNLMHGLSWSTLRSVLSVPQLREFELRHLYFCPALRSGEELDVETLAPLTHFRYQLPFLREPTSSSSGIIALTAVLNKLSHTLETLVLSSDTVPLSVLAQLHWPCLRTLEFYGMQWPELPSPLIDVFSSMPHLRRLTLKLNPIPSVTCQTLWPRNFTYHFPWADLEELTISCPDPTDLIYDHLPSTLRVLSLRCWKHVFVQRYLASRGWLYAPHPDSLLGAGAILAVLRRCDLPNLVRLEVEYRGDGDEERLLHYIAVAFPHLASLKIARYGLVGGGQVVPTVSSPNGISIRRVRSTLVLQALMAQEFASLSKLQSLKLYLNFIRPTEETLQYTAALFARAIGSLRVVMLWDDQRIYYVYHVVAGEVHKGRYVFRKLY